MHGSAQHLASSLPAARNGPASGFDLRIARKLADGFADDRRLAFARTFVRAVVLDCARIRGEGVLPVPEPGIDWLSLPDAARDEATRFAKAIATLEVAALGYAIGTTYTAALPTQFRSRHGIYYTPPALAERLLALCDDAGVDWRTARVLDPACGGGAFLLPTAKRIIAALQGSDKPFVLQQLANRLRGFELDPFGAWLAKTMLQLLLSQHGVSMGGASREIVETRDSLKLNAVDLCAYDLVIGNPPYGRVTLSSEARTLFANSIYGHANLYGIFTGAALRWVRRGGVIGYVTPTSMVSGLYFKALRSLLAAEAPPLAIEFATDRNGVFYDVLQETMLATYRQGGRSRGGRVGFVDVDPRGHVRSRKAGTIALPMRAHAPWILPRSARVANLARRLSNMGHRLSHYGYEVSTGPLVWNRHKQQLREAFGPGFHPVIWAEAISSARAFVWRSERRNHLPWFAPDMPKDRWLIVDRACVLLQRTTAKEQARRLIAAELPVAFVQRHGGVVIENHVNMVRPNSPLPKASAAAIAALLNSAAVDAAFRCINGSVAVSAFELEELPLPSPSVMTRLERLLAAKADPMKIEGLIASAYREEDASPSP